MTSPLRRPLQRDDLGLTEMLRQAATIGPVIELGWSVIRQEMHDAGWPARGGGYEGNGAPMTIHCRTCDTDVPDRHEHTNETGHELYDYEPVDAGNDPASIDYRDPTGDLAMRLDTLARDLDQMQDHFHRIAGSLRHMATIARRRIPDAAIGTPVCSVTTCDNAVEQTRAGGGYRGMELIAGHWVARPGQRPVCAAHRRQQERTTTVSRAESHDEQG